MSTATAEAEGWRCPSGDGAVWRDAAPPLFGAREILRMLRECGLTEATIAQVVGTTRQGLAAWERSLVRPPGMERLQDLARILSLFLKGAPSPRDVGRWLCAPNRHLAGHRPLELLAAGGWPW